MTPEFFQINDEHKHDIDVCLYMFSDENYAHVIFMSNEIHSGKFSIGF